MPEQKSFEQQMRGVPWRTSFFLRMLSFVLFGVCILACEKGEMSFEVSELLQNDDLAIDFEPPLEDVVALYLLTHPDFDSAPAYRNALTELVLSDPTILDRIPKLREILLSDVQSQLKVDFVKSERTLGGQYRLRIHSISKSGQRLLFLSKYAACVLDKDTQDIVQVVWSGKEINREQTYLSDDGTSLTLVSTDMISVHDVSSSSDSVVIANVESHVDLVTISEQVIALENNEGILILKQTGEVVHHDFSGHEKVLMQNVEGVSKVPNKNWVMFIQQQQEGQDLIYFDVALSQEMHRFSIDGRLLEEGWMMPGHLFAGVTNQKKMYVFDVSRQQSLVDLLLPVQPTELLIHPSLPYLVLRMDGVYQIFDVERDRLDPILEQVIAPQFDQRGNLHYLSVGTDVSEFYRQAVERDVYSEAWQDVLQRIYNHNRTYVIPKVYNFSTKEHHEKSWHSGFTFPIGYGLSAAKRPTEATTVQLLSDDTGAVYHVSESQSVSRDNRLDIQQWSWEAKQKITTSFIGINDKWYPLNVSNFKLSDMFSLPNERVVSMSGDCFYFDLTVGKSVLETCEAIYLVNKTMVAVYAHDTLTIYNAETDDVLNQVVVEAQPVRVVCDETCNTIAALFSDHWMIGGKDAVNRECKETSVDCTVADWLGMGLPLSGLLPRLKFTTNIIPVVQVPDLAVQHTNAFSLTYKYWGAMTQESALPSTPQQFFALQRKEYNGYSIAERLDAAFDNTMHIENVWYDKSVLVAYDHIGTWARLVNAKAGAIKDINLRYGTESLALKAVFDLGPAVQGGAIEDILWEDWRTYISNEEKRICPGTWEVINMPTNEKISSFVPSDLVRGFCQ